jgi:phosphatidylglycerol:prolipoprotein diacylglycerol transferase
MMQFPLNFTIYGFTIDTHLVAEGLAFFIGFRYFLYLRRNTTDTITMSNRISILIGAALGAFVGSRLVGSLENPAGFVLNDWRTTVEHIFGNRTILGGLLGGLFGVELCKKIIGESHSSGDLFTYPILLGMIIGRVGCFSMGVYESTYGNVTTFFTGMDLGDGLLRHPIMLYEIAFCMVLWLVLWGLSQSYVWTSGGKFKAFMIAYLFFRLFTEFLKPKVNLFWELNAVQLACCVGVGYYGKEIWNFRRSFIKK